MRRAAALAAALAAGLATAGMAYDWAIPAWLPPPPVPADVTMTEALVDLGRHLFHDRRLSADGSLSCASCHDPARAFADDRPVTTGVTGEAGAFNGNHPVGTACQISA